MKRHIFIVLFLMLLTGALYAEDSPTEEPTGPKLSRSAGNGAGPGSLLGSSDTLLFTGSFTHALPLEAPPGTHGLQPNVTLSYNSSSGNGWCGQGWDLSFGIIQRSTKNGIPEYDSTDTFVFSSGGSAQELTPIGTNEYRVKIDSGFMKFVYYPDSDSNDGVDTDEWIAYDKSGTRYIFGHGWGESAKVVKPNTTDIFSWSLSSIIDTNDNEIYFFYTHDQNQIYPIGIEYSHHGTESPPMRWIVFELENRTDTSSNYRAGFAITTAKRLKSIETSVNNIQVEKYELTYSQSSDIGRSLLYAVKTTKGTESLPATSFSYQVAGAPWLVSPTIWTLAGTDSSFYFCDFNSDGRMDLGNNIQTNNGLTVSTSTGSGFGTPVQWLDSSVSGDFYFHDLTGDGLTDVICLSSRLGETPPDPDPDDGIDPQPPTIYSFKVWKNTDAGLQSLGMWLEFTCAAEDSLPNLQFGDFNADGKVDLVKQNDNSLEAYITKSAGDGFNTVETWDFTNTAGSFFLFDLNGDGRTDIARRITDLGSGGIQRGLHVWFKTKDGFEDKGIWLNDTMDTYKIYFADFNGDGLLDVCQYNYKGDEMLEVYLNCGGSLVYIYDKWFDSPVKDFFFVDLNGDGLTDIARNNSQSNDSSGYAGLHVWFNKGVGSSFEANFQYQGLWTEAGTGPRNFQLCDFNGDGKTDIAWYNSEEGSGAAGLNVQLVREPIPNLLSRITNSLGGQTSVTYKPSTEYTNRLLPFPIQVVSQRIDDSHVSIGPPMSYGKGFSYKDGYYDLKTKEFLGFGEVKTIDGENNFTITKFLQTEGQNIETNGSYVNFYKGKILSQESYRSDNSTGTLMAISSSEYACTDAATGGTVTAATRWYFPHLAKIRATTYDNNVTKTTGADFSYDGYGNITEKIDVGDPTTDDDNVKNVTEYEHRTTLDNKYIVNLPKWQVVRDNTSTDKAKTTFTYDDYGRLTAKESGLDADSIKPKVTMTYDSYGNVLTITDAKENAVSGTGTGNIITTTYDSNYHTFPIKVSNSLTHERSATYDPGTGNVLTETDANGQTTTYTYDSFGRVLKVFSPIDLAGAPSTIYEYYDVNFPRRIKVQTKEAGQTVFDPGAAIYLASYQFTDGLGRTAQTHTRSATNWGSWTISGVTSYNNRGLAANAYLPFFPDRTAHPDWTEGNYYAYQSPCGATQYTYDALDRVIKQLNPDNTSATVSFSGWTETRTDAKGKSSVYEKDAFGRIIKITETINSQPYYTEYTYDTLGNLTSIKNALAETTTISYDTLGRKTSMIDPKMGTWSYVYDVNGNLISQTDAKSKITTLTYDQLGRILTKTYPDNTLISYTYDTGDYGKGRLAKVTDLSGSTEFTYDKLGRVTSTKKKITAGSHSKEYTTGSQYNASGQQTSLVYPNTQEILYTYNASGSLRKVGDISGEMVKEIEYNQNRQILRMDFNNGLTTAYEYNKNNLRLTKLITGNTSEFHFTDPTYISYDRKDHTAFREFLKSLEVQP